MKHGRSIYFLWCKFIKNTHFTGNFSFERLHLAKKVNYQRFGRIYKEKLGPGITLVQVFDPKDVQTVFGGDGRLPVRPPLPITLTASKRDGFSLGLGSL